MHVGWLGRQGVLFFLSLSIPLSLPAPPLRASKVCFERGGGCDSVEWVPVLLFRGASSLPAAKLMTNEIDFGRLPPSPARLGTNAIEVTTMLAMV